MSSSDVFKVEIVEGEEELQELERFSIWSWLQSLLRERHNETTINISLFSKKTCFKIDPAAKTQYTVKPVRSKWKTNLLIHLLVFDRYCMANMIFFFFLAEFDIYLFLVFLTGMMLFIFADSLSR